jgi:hypothetical protein
VSRLENGKQTATVADVQAWTSATGVRTEISEELIEDLRSLRVEYATWQRQLRDGFAPRQRVGRLLEDGTTTLRNFQPELVPGLLQTADYARALFRSLAVLRGQRDVEAAVHNCSAVRKCSTSPTGRSGSSSLRPPCGRGSARLDTIVPNSTGCWCWPAWRPCTSRYCRGQPNCRR